MERNVTNELIILLLKAVKAFVREDKVLLDRMVSERALCGALMLRLYSCLQDTQFAGYFVDVEFNKSKRLQGEEFLYEVKRLPNGKYITTDIIIHGRGMGAKPDNLIAIEMKKKTDGRQRYKEKRDADIERLKDLSDILIWKISDFLLLWIPQEQTSQVI